MSDVIDYRRGGEHLQAAIPKPRLLNRVPNPYVTRSMKRKATATKDSPSKRQREAKSDYCDQQPRTDQNGDWIWPAPLSAIENARNFIKTCAAGSGTTLIVPDKDADGLTSGVILYKTLVLLGLPPSKIMLHLLEKHSTVHDESERGAMSAKKPDFVIVCDQGSRKAPPVTDIPSTAALIIDHHLSDDFPEDSVVVSACHFPPVATSSLLTFEICKGLHPLVESQCSFLCAMGTHGDLGNTLGWLPPFPSMKETFKTYTKKAINDAVALVNAPRRTAKFDVVSAWNALINADTPKDILKNSRLLEARAEINAEVEKHTHTPPSFSKDGKIAILKINTPAQIHGVVATRWAGYLSSNKLEIVMVANSGYKSGFVNFSCRIARTARSRDPPVNIIESLKSAADLGDESFVARLGESFARGHKEASGGIVPVAEFEELMTLMRIGEKPDPQPRSTTATTPKGKPPAQKNNLLNYFGKS